MTHAAPSAKSDRTVLGLAFLTVFLDMLGFSVIFPLFPAMLDHYVAREGPDSAIGRFAAWLGELAAADPVRVHAFFGGILGSLYSIMQFVFAPIWGSLSDRRGRRPILLWTLAGTALAHLGWVFAGSFAVLVVMRIVGGIMAGNIGLVSAAVADRLEGKKRAHGMGLIGAGIGLGFVLGPALGAYMSTVSIGGGTGGGALALNPFSACALASLAFALVNYVWALRRFPETLPEERRGRHTLERTLRPLKTLGRIEAPLVRRTNIAYFIYFLAFGAMEFTLTFLVTERLDYGPRQIGTMFVFIGLVIALIQGGLVRRLAPRFGEPRLAAFGMLVSLPGFLLVGLAHGGGMLYSGLFLLSAGSACVMPSLSALVSRYSPPDRQGLALGVFRSLGSLSRAIGPIAGGALYYGIASTAPYFAAALITVVPLALALRLPPPPEEEPVPEPVVP